VHPERRIKTFLTTDEQVAQNYLSLNGSSGFSPRENFRIALGTEIIAFSSNFCSQKWCFQNVGFEVTWTKRRDECLRLVHGFYAQLLVQLLSPCYPALLSMHGSICHAIFHGRIIHEATGPPGTKTKF